MRKRKEELDFSMVAYWDKKYNEDDTLFEWLQNYDEMKHYIREHFSKDARILVPGCGNSAISANMYDDGYKNLVNMDFSPVVIDQMARRYEDRPDMTWHVMDIKHMDFEDNTFDIVFDKGTLDALTCGENTDEAMFAACSEYARVVKPDGLIYIVSFGQAVDRQEYFDPKAAHPWIFEAFDLLPREFAPHSHYHVYKLRKGMTEAK